MSGQGIVGALAAPFAVALAAIASQGQIFSAGPLNAVPGEKQIGGVSSHAQVSCSGCHAPFWGEDLMGDRCISCHSDLQLEMANRNSLHGELSDPSNCRDCHTEHRGEAATLTLFEPDLYPHAEFGYYLIAHMTYPDGSEFLCEDCHGQSLRKFEGEACISCHLGYDFVFTSSHQLDFGSKCTDCHDGIDTYGARFDHNARAFGLSGGHVDVSCGACHEGARTIADLQSTPGTCRSCHLEEDVHQGTFAEDCDECHSVSAWLEVDFDHSLTHFPLVGGHLGVECRSCHLKETSAGTPMDCYSCHQGEDVHAGRLGSDCALCHHPSDWDAILEGSFDHSLTRYQLTGKHAEIKDCESCHLGGQLEGIPTECVACHEKDDVHEGQFGEDCRACHSASDWGAVGFDHNLTGYPLTGAHLETSCSSCHQAGAMRGTPRNCVACHVKDDVHEGSLGADCAACHDTVRWSESTFDHNRSAFPLTGRHLSVGCASCHSNLSYRETPQACVACHLVEDVHQGSNGTACASCHNTSDWRNADFDHFQTSFPLVGRHRTALCTDCHTSGVYEGTPRECVLCHGSQDIHEGAFGSRCENCHNPSSWRDASIDHRQTGFPLNGKHAETGCASCHQNGVYEGTPRECAACHSDDDVHNGALGVNCAACHSTGDWGDGSINHDNTAFPLTGSHRGVACNSCHQDGAYAGTPKDCVSCHADDDAHGGGFGPNCASCHSTGSWGEANFDHNQSSFALTGKHRGLACTGCHIDGIYQGTPQICSACHREPDYHAGTLGTDCGICHTPEGWRPAVYNRSHGFPVKHGNAKGSCTKCHPTVLSTYVCTNCHDPEKMKKKHDEKGISDLSNCIACHPSGKEE